MNNEKLKMKEELEKLQKEIEELETMPDDFIEEIIKEYNEEVLNEIKFLKERIEDLI